MSHASVETGGKSASKKNAGHPMHSRETSDEAEKTGHCADRQERIAVAAYFRAERRGFANGDPVEDWLAAEAEIDTVDGDARAPVH